MLAGPPVAELLPPADAEALRAAVRLITKREALTRLHRFGVPASLVTQIEARRDGRSVVQSVAERADRARLVRNLVAEGIESLLS